MSDKHRNPRIGPLASMSGVRIETAKISTVKPDAATST
jgi:hypothetical protein